MVVLTELGNKWTDVSQESNLAPNNTDFAASLTVIDRRGVPVVTRARIKHSQYYLSVWLLCLSPYLVS